MPSLVERHTTRVRLDIAGFLSGMFLRTHTSLKKLGCRSLLPQYARFPIPDGPKIEKSRVDRSEVTSNLIGRYYVPRKLSEGDVWTEKFFDVFRFERHISVWKTKTTVRPELSEWIIPFRQNNNKLARKRRATKFDCFPRSVFASLFCPPLLLFLLGFVLFLFVPYGLYCVDASFFCYHLSI